MDYLKLFYIALPAFLGNMMPVVFSQHTWWNWPVDCGLTLFGKRLFGDNKKVRGFFVGTLTAILIGLLQFFLYNKFVCQIFYFTTIWQYLLFGFLSGFGALLGDALESFLKRQIGIAPGKPFIPFDQIDSAVGFLALTSILVSWDLRQIIFYLIFVTIFTPLTNLLAYAFKIKKTYW